MKLNIVVALASGALVAGMLPIQAHAQTSAVTDPVGFTTVQCLSGSDTVVSIPFTRPAEFVGAVQSVSGNAITPSSSPNWTQNQFVYAAGTQSKHYYALVGPAGSTNPKEGRRYDVVSNTNNTLTLNPNGDDISGIPQGAQISVIPYWTLATAFPASDANVTFTTTTSTRIANFKTQILIPDYGAVGINPVFLRTYYFLNSAPNFGWRLFGDQPDLDHGDDILLQDGYFAVRNPDGTPAFAFVTMGSVLTKKMAIPLYTATSKEQDNLVSITRPVDVTFDNSGLNPSNGTFIMSTSTRLNSLQDRVYLYDNTQAILKKAPSKTYYYLNNGTYVGWRLFGDDPATSHGSDVIPAGSAIIVRKVATADGQAVFWTNSPTY